MKKLMMMAVICAMAAGAQADCRWSWWVGGPDRDETIRGCQLGLASECREMRGAQVSVVWGRVEKVRGGCQAAIGYCNANKVINGCQASIVNIAREGAALQIGLLNWNPKGFVPFFPFFNFSKALFGDPAKK